MNWKDPYITYTDDYIEAGWHLIKRVHELGLLYRSGRVLHWCPRCETTLADYEVSEYVDLEDPSIYVKFRVKGQENTYLVIWTTTPWTLPANAFVMAHPDLSYAIVEANGERYIMAEARVPNVMSEAGITNYRIASVIRGKDLEGLEYEHPLEDVVPAQAVLKAYHRVVMAPEAVSATEGTGLVHAAPGHGDVDFEVGSRIGAPAVSLVDNQGRMTEQAGKYRGLYFNTSATSGTLFIIPPHLGHLKVTLSIHGLCSDGGLLPPSLSKSSTLPTTSTWPQLSQTQIGSGIPQYLCLLMTQSLTSASIESNLLLAHEGTHSTVSASLISLSFTLLTAMNHWSVNLRTRGVLHLQQTGYLCTTLPS